MRKLISTALLGVALAAAGCGTTMKAKTKVVRTTWTCPQGTAPDLHNPAPNCTERTPVAQAQPPAPEAKAELKQVHFKTGSAELGEASKAALDEAAGALKGDPSVREIRIEGRTDNTGPEALNDKLSQERADAVKSYLEDHGIPSEKVQTEALGEAAPVASNDTANGRALNRSAAILAMK